MSINNIEKQYNEDLDNLKKKINDYKNKLNQFKNLSKNTIKCNNNYLDLSQEKSFINKNSNYINWIEAPEDNYPGNDMVGNPPTSVSLETCQEICSSNPECKGIVYGNHYNTPGNQCFLKSNMSRGYPATGFKSYFKETTETNTWIQAPEDNYAGNDLAGDPEMGSSLEECQNACASDTNCKGIVYGNHYNTPGNQCFKKSYMYRGSKAPGFKSYFKGPKKKKISWTEAPEHDYPGNDMVGDPPTSVSLDTCQEICTSDPKCKGIVYGNHYNTPGNQCFKKSDMSRGGKAPGFKSYFKQLNFKKFNRDMKMCPKEKPNCNGGICMSRDNTLENLENKILTLNNDIINSFIKLNNDYKKYKNSPEMIKISKEIKLLNTIQELQVEKQLLKMENEEHITNNSGSRENIFKSENRYYNYLLLVVILLLYSIYSLYRGENYDNIDYIILFLILLYVAYVAYMTFYK